MATEGEVTLRVNLIGQGGGAQGGASGAPTTARPSGGGGLDEIAKQLADAVKALQRSAGGAAQAAGAGGAAGGFLGGLAGGAAAAIGGAALERLSSLLSVLVESLLPNVLAALDRASLQDERAAAQQVGAVTGQLARLGVDVGESTRQALFQQALGPERAAQVEQRRVNAMIGVEGASDFITGVRGLPEAGAQDFARLIEVVIPSLAAGIGAAVTGRR